MAKDTAQSDLMTIVEVTKALRCGRTYVREQIRAGRLKHLVVSGRFLIPRESLLEFQEELMREASQRPLRGPKANS